MTDVQVAHNGRNVGDEREPKSFIYYCVMIARPVPVTTTSHGESWEIN